MNRNGRLDNQVALITGSSKGIGAGIAVEFARAGADVCINYVGSSEEAQKVVANIESLGRRAIAVQADVSDREQIVRMVETCERVLGPIDILVTNAVASVRSSILQTQFEDLKRTIEIGVYGVFHAFQVVAGRMVDKGIRGSIIHVSSPHAHVPFKEAVDYNTAKAGAHQLALSAANELMWHGIRVNILEPGWTDTPGERTWYSDEHLKSIGERMPLKRMGSPEDLGRAAVFLASDNAEYIAGAVLKVDGGQFVEGGPSWNTTGRHQ
ncbi:SDR family oxidoreductase [Alicyclobacillus tolerans]|uniref:SDR family NAD(P)-dependent oxidoreductase n=1 Tax=Alicyclobacillus tolerans TaxID=90970 RepID=UPI001F3EC3B9|nr:SDR family oxidoreductase [Alicyclobacillus tolerans]MCF8564380.1 SDR family oxidoreductase [Alicyclobacillus tolerans]